MIDKELLHAGCKISFCKGSKIFRASVSHQVSGNLSWAGFKRSAALELDLGRVSNWDLLGRVLGSNALARVLTRMP